MNKRAYIDGYMHKEANNPAVYLTNVGKETASMLPAAAAEVGDKIWPVLAAAPFVLGVGAGALHSDLTSPTKLDQETVQQALVASELDEALANARRMADQAKGDTEKEDNITNERTLHI